jgi:hypothetical protein
MRHPNERRRDRVLGDVPLALFRRAGVATPPCFFFQTSSENLNTSLIGLSSGSRWSLLMLPLPFPAVVAFPDVAGAKQYKEHNNRQGALTGVGTDNSRCAV